jgi:signal recognition particle subunit SRP54
MFESLTDKLQSAFKKFGSRGRVTEEDLDQVLREVRMAMLEADVNFKVVREFTSRVKERALGAEVLRSLTPAQQIIEIVNKELVDILGGENAKLASSDRLPTVIMLVGLQGSGKTTSAAKLANLLKKGGSRPLLVACDIYRPAAVEQLVTLAKQLDVPCHEEGTSKNPREIAKNGLDKAKRMNATHLIVDTAGRLHVDEVMMKEVADLRKMLDPTEVLFVADAMAGQDAVTAAKEFHDHVETTGLILTKMDGDARGGAALSIRSVTGLPIAFIGTGERTDGLEPFHPERLAQRILGMGDILSLVERAQETVDQEEAERVAQRLMESRFTLDDFRTQLAQVKKMGPIGQLLGMIPGAGQLAGAAQQAVDDGQLRRIEAIIDSMTPGERRHPELIKASRRRRIATGSGTTPADVNRLLKQFGEMQRLMRQLGSGRLPRGGSGLRSILGG